MNQKSQLALLTLTLGLLSACSTTTRQAPVVDRLPPAPEAPRPVVVAEEPKDDAKGTYTVKRGDTLLRIALDHGQNYRDLVAWNNLANPDDIKVGQVLRVAPPDHVAVATPVPQPEVRPVPPPAPKKTGPRGDKRPYSESALAEMQKGEGAKVADSKPEPKPEAPPPVVVPPPAVPATTPGSTATPADSENLSWVWPSDGKVLAVFEKGKNEGLDIGGKPGQQVLAAGTGKVMYAGSGVRGYGNLVIVRHSISMVSVYAHNRAILVKEGQTVNKGQPIAEMGDSDADMVKLHFEIRQQGKPVDPSRFLPTR